jgi:histidine triad (HIT) family protein
MNGCVICKLINREIPAWIVGENETTICFLPLELEAYGHTIVASKLHYTDLYSTPTEVVHCVFAMAQKLANHYKVAIRSTGINLLHASGVAAQQSFPHLHIHLIPRFDQDCLDAWPKLKIRKDNKDDLLQKLRLL